MNREDLQEKVKEIVRNNNYSGTCIVPTGTGKTKIILDIINEFTDNFVSSFNSSDSSNSSNSSNTPNILYVTSTIILRDKTLPDEMNKWYPNKLDFIERICYASLKKLKKTYDLVILDECHRITKNKFKYIKAKNIIAMTATEPHDTEKKLLLYSVAPKLIEISLDEAVKAQAVSDFKITIILVNLDNKDKIYLKNKKSKFYLTEEGYYKVITNQIQWAIRKAYATNLKSDKKLVDILVRKRTRFIYNSKTKIKVAKEILSTLEGKRILLFSQSIDTANELHNIRYHYKDRTGYKLFESGEENILSSCEALNEGINVSNVDGIIVCQLNSTKLALVQRIGRSIRFRENHVGEVYIVCLAGTVDEDWLDNAASNYIYTKMTYEEWKRSLS